MWRVCHIDRTLYRGDGDRAGTDFPFFFVAERVVNYPNTSGIRVERRPIERVAFYIDELFQHQALEHDPLLSRLTTLKVNDRSPS
jgi:hypothetical protein